MQEIAAEEPLASDELAEYALSGRAWIAVNEDGDAVGYVLVRRVDQNAHIVRLSVVPEMQGRGVGRSLIDRVERWGEEHRFRSISLTTFSHVHWNQPLYEYLGFSVLAEDEIGPELGEIRRHEASMGLDPVLRVAMGRPIPDRP